MSQSNSTFSPFKYTTPSCNLDNNQSVFYSPVNIQTITGKNIYQRKNVEFLSSTFSFKWRILLLQIPTFLQGVVFLFGSSCSKMCLKGLVTHLQGLNDPFPRGCCLCVQLSTWRTAAWSKFNKSDLTNTMVSGAQATEKQCCGLGPDVEGEIRECLCLCFKAVDLRDAHCTKMIWKVWLIDVKLIF